MTQQHIKTWERKDKIFCNKGNEKRGEYEEYDLSNIRLLHAGVDTFKQLIRGELNPNTLAIIQSHYEASIEYPLVFGNYAFKVSRAGSKSGFQWILRNYDVGIVLMFKSFYAQDDEVGTHLKIEYSPHILNNNDPSYIDEISIDIANMFMNAYTLADVAVHIAVDVKGWEIPDNFEAMLRTRAKRQATFCAVSEIDFDIHQIAVKYGKKQTYTFGGINSVQFCIYDKTDEIQANDKVQYWQTLWQKTPGVEDPFIPEYQQGDVVKRLEARFHHSVVRQFCAGTKGMEVTNFTQLIPHLTGLYKYALDNFRLHHTKNYISPFWQLLIEDLEILGPCKPLWYKREYKAESSSSRRNVAFWLGNAMRLFARQQFEVDYVVNYFMKSGLLKDLKAYCKIPPDSSDGELFQVLHEFVRKRLEDHQLNGVHH